MFTEEDQAKMAFSFCLGRMLSKQALTATCQRKRVEKMKTALAS